MTHGQEFVGFLAYNNVRTGANFAIHCLLTSMYRVYKDNGNKLPDTYYHQVIYIILRSLRYLTILIIGGWWIRNC